MSADKEAVIAYEGRVSCHDCRSCFSDATFSGLLNFCDLILELPDLRLGTPMAESCVVEEKLPFAIEQLVGDRFHSEAASRGDRNLSNQIQVWPNPRQQKSPGRPGLFSAVITVISIAR
jgi:hypothetical protein